MALGLLGGGLSLLGGYLGAEATEDAARQAAAASQFRPVNISTGLGSVGFTTAGGRLQAQTQLSPQAQQARNLLMQSGISGLRQASIYDPERSAQLFTQRLGEAAAPIEERQRLDLENRLFKQGLLTSTGGAERLGALQQAQGQAELQRQLAGMQYGTQEQERLFSRALSGLQAGTEFDRLAAAQLGIAGQLGGQATQAGIQGAQFGFQAGQNRADMLSSFFGNLGQGLANYSFSTPSSTPSYPSGGLFPGGYTAPSTSLPSNFNLFG